MHRCIELALLGSGRVAPNPMVGALLVHDNRIIGEGYHENYGEAHAEVNCINSVSKEDIHLLEKSTLYVSLEPCAHFGKTPPCADLVIQKKIPQVVIGCRDPFVEVNGKGMDKLMNAGIGVKQGILEEECQALNKRFFVFHNRKRPYIILKWAQTANGKIGNDDHSRLLISGDFTNRLVHKWRSEEQAILVGTNTALFDDPELTTRLWPGTHPIRLVVDMHLRLPGKLKLFSPGNTTIVFNLHQHTLPLEKFSITDIKNKGVFYYQLAEDSSLVHQLLNALHALNIQSVLVEGGAFLLQSFIDEGAWDEARLIENRELSINGGLPAPVLQNFIPGKTENYHPDVIRTFTNKQVY